MKNRILIVDDDSNIRELIDLYMTKEGYECLHAADGQEAVMMAKQYRPSLMILDIMLPKKDGWQVCQEIRRDQPIPIIMLSAKGEEVDKVLGLELGADDYLTKPFSPRELMARVKAVLRRTSEDPTSDVETLEYGNLLINLTSREVKVDGQPVVLTPKEMELLWFLAKNVGRVFSREQLLEKVWGYEYFGDARTVDVHVKRLREKLGITEQTSWTIKTIWGVGYKFEVAAP
ncbi:MAG: response regulator transcription factor [Bacillota bacterium]